MRPGFLAGEDNVYADFRIRPAAIDEHRDAEHFDRHQAEFLQLPRDAIHVVAPREDVHVLRGTDGALIDCRDLRRDVVAADHGVGHARGVQRGRHAAQKPPDAIHGAHLALEVRTQSLQHERILVGSEPGNTRLPPACASSALYVFRRWQSLRGGANGRAST